MSRARRNHRGLIAVATIMLHCSMVSVTAYAADKSQDQATNLVSMVFSEYVPLNVFPKNELPAPAVFKQSNTASWAHLLDQAALTGFTRESGICRHHAAPDRVVNCGLQWRPGKRMRGANINIESFLYQANHRYTNNLINHLANHLELDIDLSPKISLYYEFD